MVFGGVAGWGIWLSDRYLDPWLIRNDVGSLHARWVIWRPVSDGSDGCAEAGGGVGQLRHLLPPPRGPPSLRQGSRSHWRRFLF